MPMWLKSIFFKYFIHKLSWIREYHTGFKQQLSNSRRWKLFPCSLTFDLNLHMRRFVLRFFLWISLAPTPTLAGSELLATDIVGWVPCRVVWQYSLFITTQCYCCTIAPYFTHHNQPHNLNKKCTSPTPTAHSNSLLLTHFPKVYRREGFSTRI